MKTRYKILIGVVITTLVAMVSFYIYFPILLAGPIEPLHFHVGTNDNVNRHNITIEIFNYNNKSIFKETYNLDPKEGIDSPGITKRRGKYTIKVTVDDEITRTSKAYVEYCGESFVDIGVGIDPISGEISIWIGQKLV
ncbi:MAG: hypothetical protein U9N36_11000 [Euryarchaeota archaeon]|nr:hypothetical protein [Euryarchaeota archaeon]